MQIVNGEKFLDLLGRASSCGSAASVVAGLSSRSGIGGANGIATPITERFP